MQSQEELGGCHPAFPTARAPLSTSLTQGRAAEDAPAALAAPPPGWGSARNQTLWPQINKQTKTCSTLKTDIWAVQQQCFIV